MNAARIEPQVVFWHRDLPPIEARLLAEHTIEACSGRVPGTLARRDELWHRCYQELMIFAQRRLRQEMARLGGRYAHVHGESIEPKRDAATGEAWLQGRFNYTLYAAADDGAGIAPPDIAPAPA